jgi:hypothetical protein
LAVSQRFHQQRLDPWCGPHDGVASADGVSIDSGSLGVGVGVLTDGASLGDIVHGSSSLGCSSKQQRCRRLDRRRLYPLAVRSVVS